MSLLSFPNELLFQVVQHFDANATRSARTMYSLLRTNRRFASLLFPLLIEFAFNEGHYCVTALQLAVINRDERMVRLILDKSKVDMTAKDEQNRDLLENNPFAESDMNEKVRKILEKGAEFRVRTRTTDKTPLQFAAERGNEMVLRLLLDKGVETDSNSYWERSALYCAAETGHENCVKILLEKGANVNIEYYGTTALHIAAYHGFEKVVQCLIENGADVNVRNSISRTPFYQAIRQRQKSTAKLLLENGADIDAPYPHGDAVLMSLFRSSRHWSIEMFRFLLENNASLNFRDKLGSTVLHRVFQRVKECEEVVQLLLEKGIDFTIRNYAGKLAIDVAREQDSGESAEIQGAIKLLQEAEFGIAHKIKELNGGGL